MRRRSVRQESNHPQRGQFLSELLGAAHRESVQDELSAVRVLFELLGFLLKKLGLALTPVGDDVQGFFEEPKCE